MSREKKERNKLIVEDINNGEYLVDIAKKYNVSPGMISKIKRRLIIKVVNPAASGKVKIKSQK